MAEQPTTNLARRAAPYQVAVLPDHDHCEYTDPRNEAAIEQRWRPICEQHGAVMLGIRDVPTTRVRLTLDGIAWDLEPLGPAERAVPVVVFNRWRALEAAGVPFFYWLWGEELPERPRLRPIEATRPTSPPPLQALRRRVSEAASRALDPLVIGVIPTASQRGCWVLLGRWFH